MKTKESPAVIVTPTIKIEGRPSSDHENSVKKPEKISDRINRGMELAKQFAPKATQFAEAIAAELDQAVLDLKAEAGDKKLKLMDGHLGSVMNKAQEEAFEAIVRGEMMKAGKTEKEIQDAIFALEFHFRSSTVIRHKYFQNMEKERFDEAA